jgi:hypothetical protein
MWEVVVGVLPSTTSRALIRHPSIQPAMPGEADAFVARVHFTGLCDYAHKSGSMQS